MGVDQTFNAPHGFGIAALAGAIAVVAARRDTGTGIARLTTAALGIAQTLNTGAVVGTQKTQAVTNSATYKINVSNGACSATTTTEVIFSPLPTVSFGTASLVYCTGESISLTDYSFTSVGSMVSNEWNLGDNSILNNQSQIIKSYNTPGDYSITLSASTLEGCNNTFTQALTIQATPVADFDATDGCAKETISIQNNSSPTDVTFAWEFDDATESNLSNPIKSFDEDGVHTISLSVTSSINGCVSNLDKTVTVQPLPEVDFGNQVNTCGASLLLDAFNTGSSYNWFDPTNGNASLSSSQQYLTNTDGPIGLEVTNSFGCKKSEVTTVALNTPIVVNLGSDRAVCDTEILDAGYFPGAQYAWLNGNTTRTFEANTSGVYTVTVTDQNACVASSSVELEINETPAFNNNVVLSQKD